MSKFKVGDKVRRIHNDYNDCRVGGIYEVSGVSNKGGVWGCGINLLGHDCKKGGFNYEANNFELYVENDISSKDILAPLQAAEAILNKEPLQVFDSNINSWHNFYYDLRNITLEDLKHIKLRFKPSTIVINGAEVPAPIDTVTLGYPDKVWGIDLSRNKVYDTTGHTKKGLFWVNKEDAQKTLDAVLIPFKDLNTPSER